MSERLADVVQIRDYAPPYRAPTGQGEPAASIIRLPTAETAQRRRLRRHVGEES